MYFIFHFRVSIHYFHTYWFFRSNQKLRVLINPCRLYLCKYQTLILTNAFIYRTNFLFSPFSQSFLGILLFHSRVCDTICIVNFIYYNMFQNHLKVSAVLPYGTILFILASSTPALIIAMYSIPSDPIENAINSAM